MTTEWRSAKLAEHHDTSTFDCGVEEMNSWLRDHGMRAQKAGAAITRVWLPADSDDVLAYYALAPTQVLREAISPADSGGYSVVPAYLIARLALDSRIQGQGFGTDLILDAIESIYRASQLTGGRLIVVDALDEETAKFYRHHGFHPVKGDPLRLVMKMTTAATVLTTAMLDIKTNAEIGLMSLDLHRPDGSTSSSLLNLDEAQTLSRHLVELATARQANPNAQINLRTEIASVLGRDVFGD